MKLTAIFILIGLTLLATPAFAQQSELPKPEVSKSQIPKDDVPKDDIPQNIADSVGEVLRWTEGEFLGMASATPRNSPSVQRSTSPTLSAMFWGMSSLGTSSLGIWDLETSGLGSSDCWAKAGVASSVRPMRMKIAVSFISYSL